MRLSGGTYAKVSHHVSMRNDKGKAGVMYRLEEVLKEVSDEIHLTPLKTPFGFRSKQP